MIRELFRLFIHFVLLTFPLWICIATGVIYGIGLKIGVFKDEQN